jgi:hypothetical protein
MLNVKCRNDKYHFTKAAELDKTDAEAWWGIGSLHCDIANATHFDARLGQEFIEKALSLQERPEWQADMAKACSLNGLFELAVTHQESALKHSGQERDEKLLEHYQQGKSYASFQDDSEESS